MLRGTWVLTSARCSTAVRVSSNNSDHVVILYWNSVDTHWRCNDLEQSLFLKVLQLLRSPEGHRIYLSYRSFFQPDLPSEALHSTDIGFSRHLVHSRLYLLEEGSAANH